ncbi:MAG: hypothetical protein FJ125_14410, partial [Deltaproteobacteria bacterium]|nr:hypothetical protein [Deltaproteobacteria bacterium]
MNRGTSRRRFLRRAAGSLLAGAAGAVTAAGPALLGPGCRSAQEEDEVPRPEFLPAEARAWWREGSYFVHEAVDARRQAEGLLRA